MQPYPHPLMLPRPAEAGSRERLAAWLGWSPGSRAGGGSAPLPPSTAHPAGRYGEEKSACRR